MPTVVNKFGLGIENLKWPQHPKNRLDGSINSQTNQTEVNFAASSVALPEPRTTSPASISFESFLLGPGEKKVEEKIDTRMPNTAIFTFNKEDHTLGNLLRAKLLSNSHVQFSAYRVPHPLFPTFELRVQTDGEITPKEAVLASCRDLITELSSLDRDFTREYELRKMVAQNQNAQ